MLISLVVSMQPQRPTRFNRNMSSAMHGLFFALVRHYNKPLADALHNLEAKPFTASPPLGDFERKRDDYWALPGRVYRVRFTTYEPGIGTALIKTLNDWRTERQEVEVRDEIFKLVDVIIDPGLTFGWGGVTSHEQLWDAADSSPSVTLEFTTPTAFHVNAERAVAEGAKVKTLELLFPQATQVFGSLGRKWNAHAPMRMEGILDACKAGQIIVNRYSLETQVHAYTQENVMSGFVGHCSYKVKNGDAELARKVNALADFARFAGIGVKTPQGMGQARRVLLERRAGGRGDARQR